MFVCIKQTFNFTSCTTISVYVNLSKNMLPGERVRAPDRPKRGGLISFAGAKVQLFYKPAKKQLPFFTKR